MPEREPQLKPLLELSTAQLLVIQDLDPVRDLSALKKMGIIPGSGDMEILLDGEKRLISTDPNPNNFCVVITPKKQKNV